MNHPNRSKHSPAPKAPTAAKVRAAREAAGLTQTAAASLIYVTLSAWQRWEQGERDMQPAFWELWQIKVAGAPTREQFVAAFMMGFSYTREGFNGECAFDHLAASDRQRAEFLAEDHSDVRVLAEQEYARLIAGR